MNKHYPFHTSVLDNHYGCDPYNTVDAQRLRRHVRTVAGFLMPWPVGAQPYMQAGPDKYVTLVKPDRYIGIIEAMLGTRKQS